jgi:hypothetical protein
VKLFIFLLAIAGVYTFGLLKATNLALGQVQHINNTYKYVENNADNIANGQTIPGSLLAHP